LRAYLDAGVMQLKVLTSIRRDGDTNANGEIKDAVLAEVGGVTTVAR